MSNIKNVSDGELSSLVITTTDKPLFIDFWAEWCGPCKMVEPVIDELVSEFAEYTFVKVNVDECPISSSTYGIRSIPTFVIIKNNNIVYKHSGALPKKMLQEVLKSTLN